MFNETAEKLNGRAAMVGFVAAVGSYLATGQVIPGVCDVTPRNLYVGGIYIRRHLV